MQKGGNYRPIKFKDHPGAATPKGGLLTTTQRQRLNRNRVKIISSINLHSGSIYVKSSVGTIGETE